MYKEFWQGEISLYIQEEPHGGVGTEIWRSWSPELQRDLKNDGHLQRKHHVCEHEQDGLGIFSKNE